MSNRSNRSIIYDLFDFSAPAPHGITPGDPLLLLLLAPAVPYAAAQTSTESSTSQYPYANFNSSMGLIMVVLVCAFFFMGLFAIYIRQCADNTAEAGNSRHSATRLRRSSRGLYPKVIHSFPMFHYSEVKDLKIGKGALECAVCINEFEDEETLRLLPKCDHVFHPECIDAWLASHTTCPVCRANLIPSPDEISGDPAQGTESNNSIDEHNFTSQLSEVQNQNQNQISINVDEDQNRDPQVSGIPKQNRQRAAKLPRSHSTGHSLVQPGENCERYTLILPEEVRKQIMSQRLKRTTSCVFVFPTEGSSRRGYRSGGDGSSRGVGRSDRWVYTTTPPFLSKTRSVMSPKVGVNGDVPAVGTSKLFLTSVKTPFDCLAVKGDGVEQGSTRPPV